MDIKLSFLGAAENVTGSRHFLEANGLRVLVDCGLYQERQFLQRNWDPFPVEPASIDAVLLTHAHLDHCGLLPKLVKEGFNGRIICTQATAEIARIILLDSAHIQEEDAEHKKLRHLKQGRPTEKDLPLYTVEDAEAVFQYFDYVKYRESTDIGQGLECTFYDAGHVLGSSVIRVKVRQEGEERIILFSGDIGRPGRPIICDPTIFDTADYILVESTYGNRVHSSEVEIKERIAEIVNSTIQAGGNIVVPSFALERSQEILYYVNELLLEGKIKPLKIYLDSPMASKITEIFKKHADLFDDAMKTHILNGESPFGMRIFEGAGTADESKELKDKKGVMIIAGSGMCTGGRIKYHLINNISNPENTIMFVGYQAVGTLGRIILDGEKEVRIMGEIRPVKAKVTKVNGFSAHADREELLTWLKGLNTSPRKIFIVHGEKQGAHEFADYLYAETGWSVVVPAYGQTIALD